MIQLVVGNSISRVSGLSDKEFSQLKELMSYTLNPKAQYYSHSFGPGKKSLINKKGEFPSGLLYMMLAYLETKQHTIVDNRIVPVSTSTFNRTSTHTPRRDQTHAVFACTHASRGIVVMPTGTGKSFTMALLIGALNLRTLIVVPSLELKRQLTESLTEIFGEEALDCGITVENIDSRTLPSRRNYDCLIIDEAHHSAAKTYRELNKKAWGGIFHRFFFTATPFRSQDEENLLLESICGQVIYRLDYQDAVKSGQIVPIEAFYLEVPKTKKDKEYASYAAAYSDLITNNEARNSIIQQSLVNLTRSGISTLCLVKEIAHGDTLASDGAFHLVTGQNDQRYLITDFCDRKVTTLIGTTGVLGEGVDTRPCECVIIASPVKSRNLFMQMVGRSFRRYPGKESAIIILIKDNSHKWFKSAFKEQVKILAEEYGVVPQKLTLDTSL